MGRVIPDRVQGDFHPLVGLPESGNFVKGEVKAISTTANGNPAVTLALMDTDGTVQKSLGNQRYEDVNVQEGDLVQVIGSVRDLRDKLPQLEVGNIVTITRTADIKVPKGKMKKFTVEVE